MKKIYSKPYLAVESFQLDAAIASACSTDNKETLNHGIDTCVSNTGYFGDACGNSGFIDVTDFEGGDTNDTLCYHGPLPNISNLYMVS